MKNRLYETSCGTIHYWVSDCIDPRRNSLIFLPGLTADHRLFEKQLEYFEPRCNVLVWDAPEHAASRPFRSDFSLADKARWLAEILSAEGIDAPIIIGQSMGGYVGQAYSELFPNRLRGFISIDSAPLQRSYMTSAELWLLKHVEPIYRLYPWKALLKDGSRGVASSAYGRELMRQMMQEYDRLSYARLAGHGYRMLAEAAEADLPYALHCPALLICGKEDHAGSTVSYNRRWHEKSGIPIEWIEGAGHNSNTDQPEEVNALIESFLQKL